jgi:YHS domain-containing protein
MKSNYFMLFTIAGILGLSGIAGCAAPDTPTRTQTTDGAIEAYPESTNEQSSTSAVAVSTPSTQASSQATNLVFYAENGIAIRGTDPVAYFKESRPVQGSPEFTYEWGNATWQFASAENRDLFASNPEQYAPEYGGYCAWAVSQGYTAPIDPNAWKIVNDRLYLNATLGVQRRWEQDIPGNIAKADRNWVGIQERLAQ